MDFLSLLSAPIPFLEQEQYDFNKQDKEGLTVLHFAALTMDFDWLKAALNVNKENFIRNLSTNTKYSSIPIEHIPELGTTKKTKNLNVKHQIPFGEKGFSVPHLLIWMLNHYEQQQHIDKFKNIKEITDFLFYLIEEDISVLKIKDGNGISVVEYTLMLNQEQVLEQYLNEINSSDFCPKLNHNTLEKLTIEKKAKNPSLRVEICNKIHSCQTHDKINQTLDNLENNQGDEDTDSFKI